MLYFYFYVVTTIWPHRVEPLRTRELRHTWPWESPLHWAPDTMQIHKKVDNYFGLDRNKLEIKSQPQLVHYYSHFFKITAKVFSDNNCPSKSSVFTIHLGSNMSETKCQENHGSVLKIFVTLKWKTNSTNYCGVDFKTTYSRPKVWNISLHGVIAPCHCPLIVGVGGMYNYLFTLGEHML